jgi:hypothetical protein
MQPFAYPHKTHAAKSGTAECLECHTLREDGAFSGIPTASSCAACHAQAVGSSRAEATLVNNYITQGREPEWHVYSRQPANVRFSHAIHTRLGKLACERCHGKHGESDELRVFERNRISGYSRDIWGPTMSRFGREPHQGMKMSDCVDCHQERGVEAGCLGCHR